MKLFNKKLGAIFTVIVFSFLLASCHQNSGTATAGKVGVVDMQTLLESPAVHHLSETMMKTAGPAQAKLKDAYKALLETRSEADKATGNKKKALMSQLKTQEQKFQAMMADAQKNQMKQEHELQEKVKSAISQVADNENLSYVYIKQAVLFGNADDITDKVISKLS